MACRPEWRTRSQLIKVSLSVGLWSMDMSASSRAGRAGPCWDSCVEGHSPAWPCMPLSSCAAVRKYVVSSLLLLTSQPHTGCHLRLAQSQFAGFLGQMPTQITETCQRRLAVSTVRKRIGLFPLSGRCLSEPCRFFACPILKNVIFTSEWALPCVAAPAFCATPTTAVRSALATRKASSIIAYMLRCLAVCKHSVCYPASTC